MVFFLGTILLLVPSCSFATGLAGRFTTAFYTFDRSLSDTTSQPELRAYQSVRFRLVGLNRPELSFQVYFNTALNLRHLAENDPQHRIYHVFFRWQDSQDRAVLTLGRQLVMAGIGVGRIDGIRADINLGGRVRLDLYAGTLVPSDQIGMSWFNNGYMFGVHLKTAKFLDTRLGISFYRRSRRSQSYFSDSRTFSGFNILEIYPREVEQEMIGFDLNRRIGNRVNTFVRWDLIIPGGIKTRRMEGVLRYHHNGLTISGEYLYRIPYLDLNSIFNLFTQSSNRELSFRGNYRFNRFLSLFGEVSETNFEKDRGYRVNLGANILNGYMGYIRRRGYGGVSDGLTVDLRYRLNQTTWMDSGLYMSKFRFYKAGVGRSLVVTSKLGVNYRPNRNVSVGLQVQNLSQKLNVITGSKSLPGLSHDLRFFLRATAWFFVSSTSKEKRKE